MFCPPYLCMVGVVIKARIWLGINSRHEVTQKSSFLKKNKLRTAIFSLKYPHGQYAAILKGK